jgi:hypothetical protein
LVIEQSEVVDPVAWRERDGIGGKKDCDPDAKRSGHGLNKHDAVRTP